MFDNDFVLDQLGRVKSRTFPDDETFTYTYDGSRLVQILADASGAYPKKVLAAANYDALGRLERAEASPETRGAFYTGMNRFNPLHARQP